MIQNLRSKLYLDILKESKKEGAYVIQWKETDGKNQLWDIEEQGKRVYLIRSALDKTLLLGVYGNSIKEGSYLATTNSEADAMWRIIGNVPK